MKALLLSTYQQRSIAQYLVTGLRQRIGTCEYFALTNDQQENLERFFNRNIRLSQFDRIVRLLKRNLHVMPWMRFITVEHRLVHELNTKGYDSYWIRPTYMSSIYRVRRSGQGLKCVIYHHNNPFIQEKIQAAHPKMTVHFCQNTEELASLLHEQDIFIYFPEEKMTTKDFAIIIRALACGAIVLIPNPGADACLRYHWRDGKNCLFVEDWSDALNKAETLFRDQARREVFVKYGVDLAQRFMPDKVGEMLGTALEPTVRHASDYPRKTRIFGFEL